MSKKRRRKPRPKNTTTASTGDSRRLTKSVSFEFELDIDSEGDDYAVIYGRKCSESEGANQPEVISSLPGIGDELEIFYGTIEEAKAVFDRLGEDVDIHDFCELLDVR